MRELGSEPPWLMLLKDQGIVEVDLKDAEKYLYWEQQAAQSGFQKVLPLNSSITLTELVRKLAEVLEVEPDKAAIQIALQNCAQQQQKVLLIWSSPPSSDKVRQYLSGFLSFMGGTGPVVCQVYPVRSKARSHPLFLAGWVLLSLLVIAYLSILDQPAPLPTETQLQTHSLQSEGAYDAPPISLSPLFKLNNNPVLQLNREDLVALNQLIEGWKESWQKQRVEAYLGHYVENYRPSTASEQIDHRRWVDTRRQRIMQPAWIRLQITDLAFQLRGDGQVVASMVQSYQSPRYQDRTQKKLLLRATPQGWRIADEQSRLLPD